MSGPMFPGDKVRLTMEWTGLEIGTEGVLLDERKGSPGALTNVVELADGRRVRVPVLCLRGVVPRPQFVYPDVPPALPDPREHGDGYGWMEALTAPWTPLPDAGGELLGDWPMVVVAVYLVRPKQPDVYGAVALYVEGGLEVTTHGTSLAFRARLAEIQRRYPSE